MRSLYTTLLFVSICSYPHSTARALPATSPTTHPADTRAQLDPLVKQLSSNDWRVRQKAQEQIVELGEDAIPDVQRLLKSAIDEEARIRLEAAIRQIQAWGEEIEGFQARIHAQRRFWRAGEMPILTAEVRNNGQRQFMSLTQGQRNYQLCVDGVWYIWPVGLHGGMMLQIPPAQSLDAGRVVASPIWRIAAQRQLDWRGPGHFFSDSDSGKHLYLAPGRHSIRMGFILDPARFDAGIGFRIISNAVLIEVQHPPPGKPANWPPDAESARVITRALIRPLPILQVVHRTQLPPNTGNLITSSIYFSKEAQAISANTPLEEPVAEFARAIKGLENYQTMTDPQWQTAKETASRAYARALAVLSGDPLPPPTTRPANNPALP